MSINENVKNNLKSTYYILEQATRKRGNRKLVQY